jgi:putative ABC transport system permease protein
MSLPVTSGQLTHLQGNTVALPVSEAHKLHRGIGGQITMRLGDRASVKLRIVALFTAKSGYETILLPVDLLAAHTTDGMPTQILLRASPQAISALSLKAWPGVRVADRAALLADYDTGQQTGAWVNYLLVGMIVAYTVIAVANTLIAATTRRRREFGLQRLTGATRALVLRMMGLESLLVTIVGLALGTLVAMVTLGPFCWSLRGSLLPSGPLWIYLVVIGSAVVLTFSATLVPGWVALRARPVEAAATD